jgi:hypothetical protein
VFFDPNVMVQVGVYRGVPIYADATLEPYSLVYVPVGGASMRRYERRRAGPLAGTAGSRTPWFIVESPRATMAPRDEQVESPVATAGVDPPGPATRSAAEVGLVVQPQVMESLPPPTSNRGVWIEYEGGTWGSAGKAVRRSPALTAIGAYHGFRVFRDPLRADVILVETVLNGLLAPYMRQ